MITIQDIKTNPDYLQIIDEGYSVFLQDAPNAKILVAMQRGNVCTSVNEILADCFSQKEVSEFLLRQKHAIDIY